jgi:hypothetical protein
VLPRCVHGVPVCNTCNVCEAVRRRALVRAAELTWLSIPSGGRHRWFDGCAFCSKPLGAHSGECAFRFAVGG